MINTGENGITTIATRWQPSDENHRPRSKPSLSNRYWFQKSWGCLYAILSMLKNLIWLKNLLTWNSYLWPLYTSRQQSMHLFRAKMSRQLSVVDFIQQHLPTRRRHHHSRLIFCALKDQFKPVFGHNMKTKHDYHVLSKSISSFQRLKDPTWPDKHVPRKMVPQPMMKQRLKHDLQTATAREKSP